MHPLMTIYLFKCMIGGNIATNAGGLRVLKYGTLHGSVLGLTVVQADGTILDMLRTLRKDNCGYHLSHLFIGSEGTLGIITQVAIALAPKPTNTAVVWAKLSSFTAVSSLLKKAKAEVGEILSAFEFVDESSLRAMKRISPHLLSKVQPSVLPMKAHEMHGFYHEKIDGNSISDLGESKGDMTDRKKNIDKEGDEAVEYENRLEDGIPGEICILMEFSCSSTKSNDNESGLVLSLNSRLEGFLMDLLEQGFVEDAIVSQNKGQENDLWSIREELPVCLMQLSRMDTLITSATVPLFKCIKLYKYDVSISLKHTDMAVWMIRRNMVKEMEGILQDLNEKKSNNDTRSMKNR
jgi:hypothetical protein